MKRFTIITLLLLVAAFSFSQSNATFNNLDVRGTSKFWGIPYPFGAVATSPINSAVHEIAMINNSTFALCRMDFQEFADSIANHITLGTTETASNRNTYGLYSRKVVNDLQFRGIKSTDGYIDFLDSTTYLGLTLDTANLFDVLPIPPQYWTFVNSATDTLYNNVAKGIAPGVVAIKGNLELETTTSTAGKIKQNGKVIFHSYNDDPAYPNYFIGDGSGNYTLTSNNNIGIGYAPEFGSSPDVQIVERPVCLRKRKRRHQ